MGDPSVLVISNSQDATADYLCDRLKDAAVAHCRFDTDTVLSSIGITVGPDGLRLYWGGRFLRPSDVGAIVYRRPKPFVPLVDGDTAQQSHASSEWAEAIEGFLAHVPSAKWINHPARNFAASHKSDQLTRAKELGLNVPLWLVTNNPDEARTFLKHHGPSLVAKTLAGGYLERSSPTDDTLLYTQAIDESHAHLFDRLPVCPVLFQTRVHKSADVRLIAIDDRLAAITLTATDHNGLQYLDIRRDNMRDVEYSLVDVPADVEKAVAGLMGSYGLRFAAIDFAIDATGRWVFFEINPNGQWAWLDLVGACDVGSLFADALRSSLEREA